MFEIERSMTDHTNYPNTPGDNTLPPPNDPASNDLNTQPDDEKDSSLKYSSVEMAMQFANANSAPGYDGFKSQHLPNNDDLINQLF